MEDKFLEVNLGSLSIAENQYNFDDFNSLKPIVNIDDQILINNSQTIKSNSKADELQSKGK